RTDGNRRALDFGDEPGEIVHVVGADADVEQHRLQRIAGIERFEIGQLLGVRAQDHARRTDRPGAILSGRVAPEGKRRARSLDGAIDVLAAGVGGGTERIAGGRADDARLAATDRVVPGAAVIQAAMHGQPGVERFFGDRTFRVKLHGRSFLYVRVGTW